MAKELAFLDKQNNFKKVKIERNNQKLNDDYFIYREDPNFNISDLVETIDDNGNERYNGRQKSYLIKLHNGFLEAQRVTASTPNAIVELSDLQREDPYKVRDRALQLMQNGELTVNDYEKFSNSAGNYNILENNTYFRKSLSYQNLKSFFNNPEIAQSIPSMKVELPLIVLNFERSILSYWETLKDLNISPDEKQQRLDDEILLRVGATLNKSLIFKNSNLLKDIATNYGITLPLTNQEKNKANEDLPSIPN